MQKITTFLWFDGNAEAAMNHYVSIFNDAKILNVHRLGGAVLTATFELEGQQFMALNGGPKYKFTEAISLFVSCETQEEVDTLWNKLCEGGTPSRCGWLKDKFAGRLRGRVVSSRMSSSTRTPRERVRPASAKVRPMGGELGCTKTSVMYSRRSSSARVMLAGWRVGSRCRPNRPI